MNSGEPVSVHCTISGGDLPVNVTWTLNGVPIDNDLEIFTEKRGHRIHNLMIDSISAKHAGTYTCHAKNQAGLTEHSSLLIVNGLFVIFNRIFVFFFLVLFPYKFRPILFRLYSEKPINHQTLVNLRACSAPLSQEISH